MMTQKPQPAARYRLAEVKEAVRAHVCDPTTRNAEIAKLTWQKLQDCNQAFDETRRERLVRGTSPSPALSPHCGAGARRDRC